MLFYRRGSNVISPLKRYQFQDTALSSAQPWLIEGNGYETRQSSLLYVIALVFGLDPVQNTIVVYSVLRN